MTGTVGSWLCAGFDRGVFTPCSRDRCGMYSLPCRQSASGDGQASRRRVIALASRSRFLPWPDPQTHGLHLLAVIVIRGCRCVPAFRCGCASAKAFRQWKRRLGTSPMPVTRVPSARSAAQSCQAPSDGHVEQPDGGSWPAGTSSEFGWKPALMTVTICKTYGLGGARSGSTTVQGRAGRLSD